MSDPMCERCGVCCSLAVEVGTRLVVVEGVGCKYLRRMDDGRYFCEVYPRRFELAPWCFRAEDALKRRLLAEDCPYVLGVGSYRGKVKLPRRLFERVAPSIARALRRCEPPEWVNPAEYWGFIEKYGRD